MSRVPAMTAPAADSRMLVRVLVMQIASDRVTEVNSAGALRLGARLVTGPGAWLTLTTHDATVPATMRTIEVHLTLERSPEAPATTNVFIDSIRFGGIQWRNVRDFLEATDDAWGPLLVGEAERAIRRATHSGVQPRQG